MRKGVAGDGASLIAALGVVARVTDETASTDSTDRDVLLDRGLLLSLDPVIDFIEPA